MTDGKSGVSWLPWLIAALAGVGLIWSLGQQTSLRNELERLDQAQQSLKDELSRLRAIEEEKPIPTPSVPPDYQVTVKPVAPTSCQAEPEKVEDVPPGATFTFTNATSGAIVRYVPKGLFNLESATVIELKPQATSDVYTVQTGADIKQPQGGWTYELSCQDVGDARPRIVITASKQTSPGG